MKDVHGKPAKEWYLNQEKGTIEHKTREGVVTIICQVWPSGTDPSSTQKKIAAFILRSAASHTSLISALDVMVECLPTPKTFTKVQETLYHAKKD